MPRAALRKPPPDLDLTAYLLAADSLPQQISSQSLWQNDAPLELEIGSGKGLFLAAESARRPEHHFLGVEIAAKYATHAAARLAKANRTNAKMISGDATPLLADPSNFSPGASAPGVTATLPATPSGRDPGAARPAAAVRIPTASLQAVHVYFPDPWWKKRHRHRRVLSEANLHGIHRILRPGGRFHFWTDVLDYFESTIELIAEILPQFGCPRPETVRPAEHQWDYQTHFEKRSRQMAIPVHRVRYDKR